MNDLTPTPPPAELVEEDGFVTVHPPMTSAATGDVTADPAPVDQINTVTPTYVVFDTETTGLFQFRDKETGEPVPADHPSQPRLASAAFIICDQHGHPISTEKRYVKPEGWTMAEAVERQYQEWLAGPQKKPFVSASDVNGLTDEFLQENGVPVADVLDLWEGYIKSGLIAAAHNSQFDSKMMRAELRRAGRDDMFEQTPQTCTMRSCKPYKDAGMPIKRGQYVKLEEACAFFGIELVNAHDAMADAEACRAIMVHLIRDGNLIEPKVHYAKPAEGAV